MPTNKTTTRIYTNGPTPLKELLKEKEKTIILQGADLLSAKGFTQVPNHILESKGLSPGAKLTYAMLLKYAWQNNFCFPGQKKLAKEMGSSERSIRTYLRELEKNKHLQVKQRGQGKTNLYILDLIVKKSVDNSR